MSLTWQLSINLHLDNEIIEICCCCCCRHRCVLLLLLLFMAGHEVHEDAFAMFVTWPSTKLCLSRGLLSTVYDCCWVISCMALLWLLVVVSIATVVSLFVYVCALTCRMCKWLSKIVQGSDCTTVLLLCVLALHLQWLTTICSSTKIAEQSQCYLKA